MPRTIVLLATAVLLRLVLPCPAADITTPDFATDVAPIFAKYCAGCHNAADHESEFSLETFDSLQKGGERGSAVVPGRADASLIIRVLTGEVEPSMPPEDEPRPTDADIAVLRAWIDAGAQGPDGTAPANPEIAFPKIRPAANAAPSITSLAIAPDGKRLALGRYRTVELVDPADGHVQATTPQLAGKVNSVRFSSDGARFAAATGVAGLYGTAVICRSSDGSIETQIRGHRDVLYDARLSPDGKLLATCSYDRQILLWNTASGDLVRPLLGHNGAVFELAFSADGSALASASADGTVKIWHVATGERLDTLGQAEGDQYAVAISLDSQWIVAGGADRQLRMWQFVSRERPQINPLRNSSTAHSAPIVRLAYSPDGTKLVTSSESRELVLWDMHTLAPIQRFEEQPDVVTGIAFEPSGAGFVVARIDGTWQRYAVESAGGSTGAAPSLARGATAPRAALADAARVEVQEQEPNDDAAAANLITANSLVRGVIAAPTTSGVPDTDSFKFQAQAGQQLVLEITAARNKSPLDSKLEVLDAAGQPVPRVMLQAVRSSYFTFRGHNSTDRNDFRLHRWQDMELNEYLYAQGEVTKLWMYPRGPDSGFIVYPGIDGDRYTYFGTSPIAHALNAPCYIVEPHPPGTELIPNGLPTYTVYYENDDDGRRKGGADSRVLFAAPVNGEYLVRVSDVRALGGDDYRYELTVRAPQPDFQIKVAATDLAINAGSGKEFSIVADRTDDFEGEIRVDVAGLPPGFHVSSPLVIQAGQSTAYGTITVDADAPAPTAETGNATALTASATVDGRQVVKDAVKLGELKLAERPKFFVQTVPRSPSNAVVQPPVGNRQPIELTIAPGETISAIVRVERNGFDGEIKFGGELSGRNLPHGVFVDNIGLNGLTLLQGENEREFFITAAKWVPETTRPFHLRAEVEGNQTSWPVMLHVRHRSAIQASADAATPSLSGAQ